ncbi:MAG: MBOAT family O-acyltransferase [Desulfovibrionaceae bacterium]|nr:MBOAT family O-acyltransferase [Desulfovibrionaceae bacterium]
MLFDSYSFVLLFLPILIIAWRCADIIHKESLGLMLLGFSLVFCFWASPAALLLYVCLIPVIYLLGLALASPGERDTSLKRRGLFLAGLLVTFLPLLLVRYLPHLFEKAGLADAPVQSVLLGGIGLLSGAESQGFMLETTRMAGMSFFVLIQSAWLTGIYQRRLEPEGLFRHFLFSLSFPSLLAGPVVRYEQMGPQYDNLHAPLNAELATGLGLFITGLAKKVLLADWLGSCADLVFASAGAGFPLTTIEAWLGTISFSLQIYFDFSAYTDMAIGAGIMLGLRLPENFASPYKATGFIDFWRRWHITLSSWVRDCVFLPLAGPFPSPLRLVLATLSCVLFVALWHGSSVTFLVWAAMHAFFLAANAGIRSVLGLKAESLLATLPARIFCTSITFFLVSMTWVVFRCDTLAQAKTMYKTLFHLGSDASLWAGTGCLPSWTCLVPLAAGLVTVFLLPTAHAVFLGNRDGSRSWLSFGFSAAWALILAMATLLCLAVMDSARPFIF